MNKQKSKFKSLTMWALLPLALERGLAMLGVELPEGTADEAITHGAALVAIIVAAIGRWRATKALK